MSGHHIGGLKAARTNKQKYGDSFYSVIGAIGGLKKVPKGFATMPYEKVSAAGSKGGKRSKRLPRGAHPAEKGWLKSNLERIIP